MKQQIDIVSKITFQVPVEFDKESIKNGFNETLNNIFQDEPMERVEHSVISIAEEKEIVGSDGQDYLVKFNVRIGEDEYTVNHVVEAEPSNNPERELEEEFITGYFGEAEEVNNGGYWYSSGCKVITILSVKTIEKHELQTVLKFI